MRRVRGAAISLVAIAFGLTAAHSTLATAGGSRQDYGIASRVAPQAYLRMPRTSQGRMPQLLSQTGAFADTRRLKLAAGLIPYDLIVPFWSDGAEKSRWVAVPKGRVRFSPAGEWMFPAGSVFVKTFQMPVDATHPEILRRLETRLLVRDNSGGVYGVTYKWRADNSDADLLDAAQTEQIAIGSGTSASHVQAWYYPSRKDCLTCHTASAGGVLGPKTRQFNRLMRYPSGRTDNELRAWNHLGLFEPSLNERKLSELASLAAIDDETRSLEDRARSYLDSNCAHCHRPGGTVAGFDARFETPLAEQALIGGPVLIDEGIDRPRIIAPHDIWRSIAFMRVNALGDIQMPPLARETIDERGVELLRRWVTSLPGREVLEPPSIFPAGGTYSQPIEVSLIEREPDADIRFTLDGSVPGPSDARYEKPIKLTGPTVLRTRAYKEGFTRSITAQQVYIVAEK